MDALNLARSQFAITTIYHFLFVPLTLGLSVFIALMATIGYKRKDDKYNKMSDFFGKLFLINFAVGVVTGIVQEFQFGMNWSGHSRFVGDVFGAPLAIEALAAFFLESTFLGIWVFGKDKISEKKRLASIWIVAFASNLSAYWILVANSFMQDPKGYVLRNGRAEMTDFFELVFNKHVFLQFGHVVTAGIVTAACFIVGISAYKILKGSKEEIFPKALNLVMPIGLAALVLVSAFGDLQGKYVAQHQPMKLAAMEAHWETQKSAPLSIFSIINEKERKNTFDIAVPIPGMLSFMAANDFNFTVQGINDLQKQDEEKFGLDNYTPPVNLLYISFRLMVGFATLMIFVLMLGIFLNWKKKLINKPWMLKVLVLMLPIPYICNSTGWIITEMGRQPWLVYKVLKLQDGLSKAVGAGEVLFSVIVFTAIYGAMAVLDVYLILRIIKNYPEIKDNSKNDKEGELWA